MSCLHTFFPPGYQPYVMGLEIANPLLAKPDLMMWCLKDCLGEGRVRHRASISFPRTKPPQIIS